MYYATQFQNKLVNIIASEIIRNLTMHLIKCSESLQFRKMFGSIHQFSLI